MCTAATYTTRDHYFGRNLDLEHSYHETVCVTPRNKTLPFRHMAPQPSHLAMIGMAFVVDGFPLYYDDQRTGTQYGRSEFPGKRAVQSAVGRER